MARGAVAYFGAGDECHMAFHFPLMPRLFMALRTEDRLPVEDILAQTPPIPDGCHRALFLATMTSSRSRLVTDEERLTTMLPRVRARPNRANQPRHPPPARAVCSATAGAGSI